ncbi:glycosyltransferase family 4 protein [Actinoplanes sp. KI2]|uniref:glycosyltransferase family 4 protein n=1 Tax=Actinoplanes sp. KI2 TaxID=2983315 RepID=UPI0021D5E490|nr:glycosyltransferase family 4 protein [Actinoplanes sp. KI2]MCU7728463.1 glycosyltransferase family 4 protein [Actinoplanes sp. KI2]
MRIALLTYRGNPFCGGQGVYVRHLSRELAALGHRVEVLSGPPYPQLDDGVTGTEVPSLDLYREPDPFRLPALREYRDWIDVLEVGGMLTAGFPEPFTFSLRVRRLLRGRRDRYDVVHDNQTLGYGLLGLDRLGLPLVTTVHHPIQIDRRLELDAATGWRRLSLRRWYGFVGMQRRVARRLPRILTVSDSSAAEIVAHLGVAPHRIETVPIGTDAQRFSPGPRDARRPGRLITTASADVPLKGLHRLLEAVAVLRGRRPGRPLELVVVGEIRPASLAAALIARHGLGGPGGVVRSTGRISDADLVDELRAAEVAVVPSLFEGFSLPALEAMACGLPVVATTAGGLPETVGPHGEAALLVPPDDAEALATAIETLLDNPGLRDRLGTAGRRRVLDDFTWAVAARRTEAAYRKAIDLGSSPRPAEPAVAPC